MTTELGETATTTPVTRPLSGGVAHLRDLLITMVSRDLKLRYNRSLFGIAWSFVTPLSQLLVLNLVFTRVVPLEIPNYGAFLFVGILSWTWFASALDQATGSIVEQRELVRQPGFPVGILPVITVATNLVHFALALPILVLVVLFVHVSLGPPILLLPVLIVIQFLFTLGLGFFVATSHVTFRDTKHLLGIVLLLGFYLTPVFYPADRAPEAFSLLYRLNPMAVLITAYRDVLLEHRVPSLGPLAMVVVVSGLLLATGYQVFHHASNRFVDEI